MTTYFSEYLAPASAALAAFIAYLAVYKNSQPQVVAYYEPSSRQQSLIDLVIENVGTGVATDVRFSKPIPIAFFGISAPDGEGRYIPTSGFPLLSPGQGAVFYGGQYGGLLKVLGDRGLSLDISYTFDPPLWCDVRVTTPCVLAVKHLEGAMSVKSMEQAVVDAIEGRNPTTLKDIRGSLQSIDATLKALASRNK